MKKESNLGGVHVDPSLENNPAAVAYRRQVEERMGTYSAPRGGGPTPPIPRLDLAHQSGMTMADQARAQMPPPPPPGSAVAASSFFVPGATPQTTTGIARPTGPGGPARRGPQIFPDDVLPEAATRDEKFIQGQGQMYAAQQPELALKYGVIRKGKPIPPQQLMGTAPGGGLSAETVAGINAVADLQQKREKAESDTVDDRKLQKDAAEGPAGQGARYGVTGDDGERPLLPEEQAKLQKVAENLDNFDFHTLSQMMMKDILNNEDQKKMVESRLKPMDVSDYVMQGYVTQEVPINPSLTYEFQSMTGEVDLALKRLIVKEAKGFNVDDRYVLDKYSIMSIACSLRSVNKKPLPAFHDNLGNFDDEKFYERLNFVMKMGFHILASVGINGFWFDLRVRRLVRAESLGNG